MSELEAVYKALQVDNLQEYQWLTSALYEINSLENTRNRLRLDIMELETISRKMVKDVPIVKATVRPHVLYDIETLEEKQRDYKERLHEMREYPLLEPMYQQLVQQLDQEQEKIQVLESLKSLPPDLTLAKAHLQQLRQQVVLIVY